MPCRISRSRRRSGHGTGPGTGIGIVGHRIQYRKIPSRKNRRSINLVLRSIGRSISTSRSASTVPGTTAPSRRRTSPSFWRLRRCRSSGSRCPRRYPTQAGSALVSSEAAAPLTFMAEAPLNFMAEIVNEVFADPAEPAATDDSCCAATEPRGAEAALRSHRVCFCRRLRRRLGVSSSAKERFRRLGRGHRPAREGFRGCGAHRPARAEAGAAAAGAAAYRRSDPRGGGRARRRRPCTDERCRRPPGVLHAPGRRVCVRLCFRPHIALGRRRGASSGRGS